MRTADLIMTKRDGGTMSASDVRAFIRGYTDGDIPDYQAAALLMAIFWRGMQPSEFVAWTDAMLHSGDVLDLSDIPGFKVDKHSTGGVGDKISLILAPLVACAGVPVPMISGRGLGHTGGTLDKLESIPGFVTALPVSRFRELVATLGCGLIGQTPEIAPADRKLYALRDATSTVECIPLIASSIMSKKLAEGIDGLVLDVKTGSGAFMRRYEDAVALAKTMIAIGEGAGREVVVLVTDMNAPLGSHVGNALEVIESCDVLRGKPGVVRELTLELGVEMVRMGRRGGDRVAIRQELEAMLDDGRAMARFAAIVDAQGGDVRALDDYSLLPTAARRVELRADRSGEVDSFVCNDVGRASMMLGAGRARKEDAVDPAAGVVLHVERGTRVQSGDLLAELFFNDDRQLDAAVAMLRASIVVGEGGVEVPPLVLTRL
jgi:pyrimidine-nucleoside phosphorylase